MRILRTYITASALCVLPGICAAQMALCGDPYDVGTGPWDYRTASQDQRMLVERRHFTPEVRMMQKGGGTSRHVAADIAYTLKVFPNHPQALMTMSEWSLKSGKNPPEGSAYTVECWFERAVRFAPDDAMVKVVYGIALIKRSKAREGVAQLEAALPYAGNNANVHYNLGLAYFDLKEYDKALVSARAAYRLGFPLPGLRNKLKRAGVWRETGAVPASPGTPVAGER